MVFDSNFNRVWLYLSLHFYRDEDWLLQSALGVFDDEKDFQNSLSRRQGFPDSSVGFSRAPRIRRVRESRHIAGNGLQVWVSDMNGMEEAEDSGPG